MQKTFQKVWRKWKEIVRVWGILNSFLILTLFYFVIIGPVALIRRVAKSRTSNQDSYWIRREEGQSDFKKQF